MGKKIVGKGEKVGLRLTVAQRKLILEDPIHIHDEPAKPIRSTAANASVMLTLADWSDLAGVSQQKRTRPPTSPSERSSTPSSSQSRAYWRPTSTSNRPSP